MVLGGVLALVVFTCTTLTRPAGWARGAPQAGLSLVVHVTTSWPYSPRIPFKNSSHARESGWKRFHTRYAGMVGTPDSGT